MRNISPGYLTLLFALLVITTGCGKDYKKEIIGKWVAVENNCDESGKCESDEKVTGSTSYTPDGRMTVGDLVDGKYVIEGKKIKFILYLNKVEVPGETEILYLKKNILLSRTTFGTDRNEQSEEIKGLAKQEPFIVKYQKEGS
jgi:hypothetical protein